MQEKAIFHLFIPSLFQYLNDWHRDFSFEVKAPNLSSLLRQHEKYFLDGPNNLENDYFRMLNSEIHEVPVAYYRNQVQNNTIRRLMCADPIHLEVGMSDVTLTNKITDLTDTEAKELISILNAYFQEDGLEFIFGSNQSWYISLNEEEKIESYPLESMLMKNVIGKLATSKHRNWQVIQNEIQMLLHSSEINQQREMAGLETINSLWLWGGGEIKTSKVDIEGIYIPKERSSKLRARYFAKAANCEWHYIPDDINQMLTDIDVRKTTKVLLLEQLFIPALEDNIDEFQQRLTQIDNQIIKPLARAWQSKEIEIQINCCDGTVLKPQRPLIYKLWLKPKKLREIVNETRT